MKRLKDSSSNSRSSRCLSSFVPSVVVASAWVSPRVGGGWGRGFSAGEQRRAVRARQHSHFAGDLPNLVERACVRPPVAIENVLAEIAFAQPLKRAGRQRAF